MPNPSRWGDYSTWRRANASKPLLSHIRPDGMNRFQSRYRLASGFRGVNVDGFSEKTDTLDGYGAVLKVGM